MKKVLLLIFALLVCISALFAEETFGLLIAAPPIVLSTQQIVFIRSLKEEYEKIDTWLNEAQDLGSFVIDGQTLRFPEAGEDPAVYKNRTTDIDSVEPTETTYDVSLDYYDSQNYKLRNINMHALPFDKMAHYTKKSAKAIRKKEIADAAYNIAPSADGNKTVVIGTTGPARNGLKMARLEDIVSLARACDRMEFPEDGRHLVLPSDMWWDLIQNNDILKAQLSYQQNTGIINPQMVNYYGFKIHKASEKSLIPWNASTKAKAAQGTAVSGVIVPAGFAFCSSETFRAGGSYDMYLKNKSNNPTGRADEFGFSHRFKAGHQLSAQRYTAILYQAVAEASNTPFVSIQPTSLEDFAAAGGSKTVAVTASGEWNIVNDTATDTWITVSKSGNNAIIATAANTAANAEDRIGSVTISVAGTSATLTIDVTQLS